MKTKLLGNVITFVLGAVKEEGTEGVESKPNLVVLLMSLLNSEVSFAKICSEHF